jgi:hypothetical protein
VLRTPPRVLNSTAANCGPPFGTKRPQVQILSPRPVSQVADLRECRALRAASHLPAIATEASREQKGTRGNPRESRGRLRRAEEHPASPHDVADPAAQQGPSGYCDPPSATKRPFGWDVRRPGITTDPKSACSSSSAPSPSAPSRRIRSTPAPSTQPIECVQMTEARPLGVRKGSPYENDRPHAPDRSRHIALKKPCHLPLKVTGRPPCTRPS